MIPRPSKNYFLIRVSKEEQKDRKEKMGSIFIAPSQTYMTRNMQYGEIVGIGNKAHEFFPEAKIGHILLTHHFVEGKDKHDSKESHLIYEDADFNYYVVAAFSHNGKGDETYGVWTGEKLIPCKEFVFLNVDAPPNNDLPLDEYINQSIAETDGGLLVFREWKEDRETTTAKMQEIKQEVHNLSKGTKTHTLIHEIKRKEEQMAEMSAKINQQRYEPYTIAAANPLLHEWFDKLITEGEIIYTLHAASQTIIEFMGKQYRMVPVKYIGFLLNEAA